MDRQFVDDVPQCPGTRSSGGNGGNLGGGRGGHEPQRGFNNNHWLIDDARQQFDEINRQFREINENQARLRRGSRTFDPFYLVTIFAGIWTAIFMAAAAFEYPISSAIFATSIVMIARCLSKHS